MKWFCGAVLALGMSVVGASAATIDFESVVGPGGLNTDLGNGFVAEDIRIVSGNCSTNGGQCAALNTNGPRGSNLDLTTIRKADNSAFTITSYWFQRLGRPAEVTVATSKGDVITWDQSNNTHNTGTTVDTTGNALFEDIFFISFDNSGTGNIRIDDLVAASIPGVPLPASSLLLLGALAGAGGVLRTRKKRG